MRLSDSTANCESYAHAFVYRREKGLEEGG